MIYSVVNIPYGSIMASMTRDNDEVLKLTSTRMVCANIGQIVVQAGFPIGLAMVVHEAINWNQAIFMAIGTIPAFIILPSLPMLKSWLGKKGLYYMLLAIGFVGFCILYTIGKFFDVESCNTLVQTAKVMTGVGLLVGSLMWALVPVRYSASVITSGTSAHISEPTRRPTPVIIFAILTIVALS